MKTWQQFAMLGGAAGVGLVLKAVGIEPNPSPGWLLAMAVVLFASGGYQLDRGRDAWESDPRSFAMVERLVLAVSLWAAAIVCFSLAMVGGLSPAS
jgi:hypothetical protein